jgi:hypothetical protein
MARPSSSISQEVAQGQEKAITILKELLVAIQVVINIPVNNLEAMEELAAKTEVEAQ